MKKYLLLIIIFAFLGCKPEGSYVCFKEHCFNVELAEKREDLTKGLMFRESLDQNAGMLFVFQESGFYGFWMKNTLIPLDIIWIDEGFSIVDILKNAPPCKGDPCLSYVPGSKARYVLEINAGLVDELGIKTKDKAVFEYNE